MGDGRSALIASSGSPNGVSAIHCSKLLLGHLRHRPFMVGGQAVFLAPPAVHNHRGQHGTQSSRPAFHSDVGHRHDRAAARALGTGARHGAGAEALVVFAPLRRIAAALRHIHLHPEDDAGLRGVGRHRQQHALALLPAQPAGLKQRQRGAALLADHGTRPEVGHGGFDDPARGAGIAQIGLVELGVERSDAWNARIVYRDETHRTPVVLTTSLQRFVLREGRVICRKLASRLRQYPPPPRPHVPGKVRLEQRIVETDQVELNPATVAVPEPLEQAAQRVAL